MFGNVIGAVALLAAINHRRLSPENGGRKFEANTPFMTHIGDLK